MSAMTSTHRHGLRHIGRARTAAALVLALGAGAPLAAAPTADGVPVQAAPPALNALPSLELTPYLGRWYQVALYPNSFQKQCVSDTTATYSARADGAVEVLNRCRNAAGAWEEALGLARPDGSLAAGLLKPAQLKVSFLPAWLRWLPVGWGSYWVIDLAPDQRYAVVSEPSRQYLWILSRTPQLQAADEQHIRGLLTRLGFDLSRLQAHRQTTP